MDEINILEIINLYRNGTSLGSLSRKNYLSKAYLVTLIEKFIKSEKIDGISSFDDLKKEYLYNHYNKEKIEKDKLYLIMERYKEGESLHKLAQEHLVSSPYLLKLIKTELNSNTGKKISLKELEKEYRENFYSETKKRDLDILNEYKKGYTVQEIADSNNLTRQRISQLLKRAIEKEYNKIPRNERELSLINYSKKIKNDSIKERVIREVGDLDEKNSYLVGKARYYFSLSSLSREEKIPERYLKKYFPEVSKIIEENIRKKRKKWSTNYYNCRECRETRHPHQGYGLCKKCYAKSDYFKEINRNNYLKHKEERDQKNKEYMKKPEVKEKLAIKARRLNDEKNFDGNREVALRRDQFQCTKCGLSRAASRMKYKIDLYVKRVDGNNENNDISNLKTLCRKCFQRENIGTWLKKKK